MDILTKDFYDRDTLTVARDLLGRELVRVMEDGTVLRCVITETEAYVLPMLEEIKRRYLDWNDAAFLLKYQILALLETQKALLSGQ